LSTDDSFTLPGWGDRERHSDDGRDFAAHDGRGFRGRCPTDYEDALSWICARQMELRMDGARSKRFGWSTDEFGEVARSYR